MLGMIRSLMLSHGTVVLQMSVLSKLLLTDIWQEHGQCAVDPASLTLC